MKNIAGQVATDVVQNQKIAAAVATTTTGSGILTTYLEMIPSDVGKIATLAGICLSIIVAITTLIRHRKQMRIMDLDEKLKLKELEK